MGFIKRAFEEKDAREGTGPENALFRDMLLCIDQFREAFPYAAETYILTFKKEFSRNDIFREMALESVGTPQKFFLYWLWQNGFSGNELKDFLYSQCLLYDTKDHKLRRAENDFELRVAMSQQRNIYSLE